MKKIIILSLIFLTFILIGCSKDNGYQEVVYDIPDNDEIFFCENDQDCGHVRGCNEDGGSPCINIEFTIKYGHEKRNCNPDNIGFCFNCKCIENRCTNIIDPNNYGC